MLDGDRMDREYSIVIEHSPAYELIISLYNYINNDKMKEVHLKGNWLEETKLRLPERFINELQDERWEVLHRIVLLISQCEKKSSIPEFLNWFENLSAGEIYERLAPWVESISNDLSVIRDRSVDILYKWNEYYFKSIDPTIQMQLKQDAISLNEKLSVSRPIDIIETATNGLRIEQQDNLRKVILVPQYHCSPSTILDYFDGIATCLYPINKTFYEDGTRELVKVMQCLGDETRLNILIFLSRGPRSLIEIHKHMNLAKSTVHHHITKLKREGIIRSHFIGSSIPAFYSLRKEAISKINNKFMAIFEGEENFHE